MTKAQERARARRRYDKQVAAMAQREADTARNKQVVGVVAVVLVLVGAFILATNVLRSDPTTPAAQSPTATAPAALAAGCAAPPKILGTTARLTLPDKASVVGKKYDGILETTCGDLIVAMDGSKAPQAVASFQQLAQKNYWNNSPCHRLTTQGIFVLQCGDPTGSGSGSPGYGYGVENAPTNNIYPRGTIAMARTQDAKTGTGGQFFIVYKDTTLTGGYTILGTVTNGMEIVDKIAAAGVTGGGGDGAPKAPISIYRVTMREKG